MKLLWVDFVGEIQHKVWSRYKVLANASSVMHYRRHQTDISPSVVVDAYKSF